MSEITGIVESIGTKEVKTRFGMKPTFSMKVDGEWYKLGFTKPKCDKGDEVSFSYVEGTYGREVDAKAINVGAGGSKGAPTTAGAVAPRAAPSYGGKGVFPIPALDGQRAIVRQNALTNARELVVGCAGGKPFAVDDEEIIRIIAIARKFEAYACGDLDARRAEEMKDALAKRGPTAEEVME
jgi:hypothetical protein